MLAVLLVRAWSADNRHSFVLGSRERIADRCELVDDDGKTVAIAKKTWGEAGWHFARFDATQHGKARHADLRLRVLERRCSLVLDRPALARIARPLRLADLPAMPAGIAAPDTWQPRGGVVLSFPAARA